MAKIRVESLTEAQETLLMPLWSRAQEARHPEPILVDRKAVEIVDSLDYDFDKFRHASVDPVGYCSRAAIFDMLVQEFLQEHPAATVVEIGAGLDTRFDRIDNGQVQWFDLDLPEAMSVRRRFFEQTPRRRFLATSVLAVEWFQQVQEASSSPAMFVSEGVFYFFAEQQLRELFGRLADHFPGSRIVFDSQSPLFLWYSNRRHPLQDSRLQWSIANVRQIETWDRRFVVEKSVGFGDSPYYDKHFRRFGSLFRFMRRLWPPVRNMFRISVVRLG